MSWAPRVRSRNPAISLPEWIPANQIRCLPNLVRPVREPDPQPFLNPVTREAATGRLARFLRLTFEQK